MEGKPLGLQCNSMAFIFLSQIPTTAPILHQIQNPLPDKKSTPDKKFQPKMQDRHPIDLGPISRNKKTPKGK